MNFDRFTLVVGQWYGLTMFPGYSGYPYHSPIRVDAVQPLGRRMFELRFLNLGYAVGVQDFTKKLLTLRRTHSHIVAKEAENQDRTYVIVSFNQLWLDAHFPNLKARKFFDSTGHANDEALLGLAG